MGPQMILGIAGFLLTLLPLAWEALWSGAVPLGLWVLLGGALAYGGLSELAIRLKAWVWPRD